MQVAVLQGPAPVMTSSLKNSADIFEKTKVAWNLLHGKTFWRETNKNMVTHFLE